MSAQRSEACSQASEALTLDWSESVSAQHGSASETSSASKSSPNTGPVSPATTMYEISVPMRPVWTYSRVASHASPSATQGDGSHKMTSDGYGQKLHDSFAYFDREQCCWKTSQVSLLPDSETSSVTWPRAGMTRNGIAYRLRPLAPLTGVIASSSWPTPCARDYRDTGNLHLTCSPRHMFSTLPRMVHAVERGTRQMWPTPCAGDDMDRGNLSTPAIQRRAAKGKQLNLSMVVSDVSGNLNPTWVEWLMGFPAGWTDLGALETPSYRKSLKSSGGA